MLFGACMCTAHEHVICSVVCVSTCCVSSEGGVMDALGIKLQGIEAAGISAGAACRQHVPRFHAVVCACFVTDEKA